VKKYELTNETISFENRKLFRIRALKDFGNVKAGDLGGYVESENNLSQEDNCWIYENARVYGNAEVSNDDIVSGNARVYDDAMKIKKELNSRQWALYEHLKYLYMLNDSEWHNLKDLCNALKSFKEYHYKETANFNNTSARRIITDDLNILANSEEIERELSKKKISILKQINRLNKQYKKSVLNGQYRLVFGKEKEIIEVFG